MKITRIDLVGRLEDYNPPQFFASIQHVPGSDYIAIKLTASGGPCSELAAIDITVDCHNDAEAWEAAKTIQEHLDGYPGTEAMIHDYFMRLKEIEQ